MAADQIHWGSIEIDWDGDEGFTLHVNHALSHWPARWLAAHLPARVEAVLGPVDVSVIPARWTETGVDTWGDLSIGPLGLPLSDPEELRRVVEKAADDADAAGDAARNLADEADQALRRA